MGYKTTIVYAEDNRDISILMDDYFKIDSRMDFEIIGFAYDGCEALDMISSMNPDIVLLDMKMPNLNGWEVLERINEMAPEKRPVIIALSAVDDSGFVRKVLESGAAAYIKKPFEMKRLLDELQNVREALTQ